MIVEVTRKAIWDRRHHLFDATNKWLVSTLLIVYFGMSFIHQLPDGPLANKFKEPTHSLMECFGWLQNWHLFGPELRTNNFHCFGLIGYEDGTIGSWEPPRFELLTLHQKYCKDKFHKWDQDCIAWDNYREFWPDLARYVARIHYDEKNKPVWFMLLRLEADISDPTRKISFVDRMPAHTRLLNSFVYHFKPEDFK